MLNPMRDDDEEEEPKAHELRNLRVNEVSLVSKPATGRTFLLWKSADLESEMLEEDTISESLRKGGDIVSTTSYLSDEACLHLEESLNSPADGEDEVMTLLEKAVGRKLSEEAKTAVRAALRALDPHKDEIGKDLLADLLALAGYGYAAPEKQKKPKPEEEHGEQHGEEYGRRGKRKPAVGGLVSKANDNERLEVIEKAYQEDDAGALVGEIDAACLGKSGDESMAFMESLSPEVRGAYRIAKLTGVAPPIVVEKGGLPVGDALAEIMRRADHLVLKGEGKMSVGDAQLKVMEDDPALAARYRREVLSG